MRISPIVFAYDFPHQKTQDVVLRLLTAGMRPSLVIGAPPVALRVPPPGIRVKPRHVALLDPAALCQALDLPYVVADHGGEECLLQLAHRESQVGVIAGARILPRAVIEQFSCGVINFHPGLIPDVRGLDALQWALYRGQPLGVTAHLIDHRVDAGWILERRVIDEYPDDTLVDLSLRLYETQLAMLPSALALAIQTPRNELPRVEGASYNRSFPRELVPQLQRRFAARREALAADVA